jgi:hypothetical protein
MIVYHQNGCAFRTEPDDYVCVDGEVAFTTYATDAELKAAFSGYAAASKPLKVADINGKYTAKFESLISAYAAAYLNDGTNITTKQENLATAYQKLVTAKAAEIAAL